MRIILPEPDRRRQPTFSVQSGHLIAKCLRPKESSRGIFFFARTLWDVDISHSERERIPLIAQPIE